MRNSGRAWILLPLAMIVCMVMFYWIRSAEKEPSESATKAELDKLRKDVQRMREEGAAYASVVAQAAGHQDRTRFTEPAAQASAAPPAIDSVPKSPEPQAPSGITEAEMGAQLDEKFDAEHVDPVWSRSATSEATAALNGALTKGTTLRKVECRTNLCKVESFHENVEAFRQFAENAFMSHDRKLWNGGIATMVRSESASGVTAISYIAKEGQGVPVPDVGEE